MWVERVSLQELFRQISPSSFEISRLTDKELLLWVRDRNPEGWRMEGEENGRGEGWKGREEEDGRGGAWEG